MDELVYPKFIISENRGSGFNNKYFSLEGLPIS